MEEPRKASTFTGVSKGRYEDEPSGTAICSKGHMFYIANFHQKYRNGQVMYEISGYCFGCKNSVLVLYDHIPAGANRDYRILGRVE